LFGHRILLVPGVTISAKRGGLPPGGAAGLVLTKNTEANYDASWVSATPGGVPSSGVTSLISGQSYVDVVFPNIQTTDTWTFNELVVVNTVDTNALNIYPLLVTSKTALGFRVQLNGAPDSSNYYLHWTIKGIVIAPGQATTYFASGPSSSGYGIPATFTVFLAPSTTVVGILTVTMADGAGGAFSPTSVQLTTGVNSVNFDYTPVAYGVTTVSFLNNGGLINPTALGFTCNKPTYTLVGPSTGDNGVPSTDFTVQLSGPVIGTVTVTPSDGGGGGTFAPTTVALSTGTQSATFTYTPGSVGSKTISVTNNGTLANPANLTYVSTSSLHLLNTLISYWKMDEATSATRNDSVSTNHLSDNAGAQGLSGKINNGAYFSGSSHQFLNHASNSSLQVTSDFTFSLWTRIDDVTTANQIILGKDDNTSNHDYELQHDSTNGFIFQVSGISDPVGAPASQFAWYHIVVWYDSVDSKLRMRINDATTYVSSGAATLAQSTAQFTIGGDGIHNAFSYTGFVDEVGFWKRKLTAGEITALYNSGNALAFSNFTT
jgi:hypothetical protein